ncbi:MAG: sulfite exporter TauE/SafE family protein [Clostridiales bacterium]|nr:sulfite exporter TauE/SafE family protein [Clostridiales bacterium]
MLHIIIGLISGIISGMGIGGGTVLIPALSIFFKMEQQTAQNINLLYFIPTAIIAISTHAKQGNIEKKQLSPLILLGLAGAAAGSLIAVNMNAPLLRKLFGFFLLAMGAYEFFRKEKKSEGSSLHESVQ